MPATYSHTGYRPLTGYHARSVALSGHRDERGRVHAITGTDYQRGLRVYVTVCGDSFPVDDDSADTLTPAADQSGSGVTCRKCRAAIGVTASAIKPGDRVRRRLASGKLSERIGTVQVVYDGETHALVCWESSHGRLAYRSTRDHVEALANLVQAE